jgi:uncharacterized membrane protein HdeD (DUF308 family)
MTNHTHADISATISVIGAVVTISSIQPIVSLFAGLVAIVSGVFAIRYYYWKTKHMNNDKS